MESGERDPHAHRFLGSGAERPQFEALSRQGSGGYVGLETFDNPGCPAVEYFSDEVTSKCPVTGQPDYYDCRIILQGTERLIESKSLKLFFNNLHENSMRGGGTGIFCEALALHIKEQVAEALECVDEAVTVILVQKPRGGISIKAQA